LQPAKRLFALIAATEPNQRLAEYLMGQYGSQVEDLRQFRLAGSDTDV
jgi:hypothetical protein